LAQRGGRATAASLALGATFEDHPMQHESNAAPADRAVVQRREVLTFWAFVAFLLAGVVALGIDALMSYA
jgi:hypothetical protein